MIVEKPAFSTPTEMDEIIELANQKRVFSLKRLVIFMRNHFKTIADFLPSKDQIIGADFSFMKYSSALRSSLDGGDQYFSPHFQAARWLIWAYTRFMRR